MKTQFEDLMKDPGFRKAFSLEKATLDAAELIAKLMDDKDMSKADLARHLGKSRAWVTQLLSGKENLTVRTLAEILYALGYELDLGMHSLESGVGRADPVANFSSPQECWPQAGRTSDFERWPNARNYGDPSNASLTQQFGYGA